MKEIKPLVSIVLPVYNRPSVIQTITSVLNQTYEHFELIIIDNASTDNTVDRIRTIQDERINLIINEKNEGQTYSLNRGLREAKGVYIARIDADDLMTPDRIEKQVDFLESNPDYGLVGSWVRFIDLKDRLSIIVRMPITDKGMRLMQTISCGIYHPTAMLRKRVLDEYNLHYDLHVLFSQDYDLWRAIMNHSKACNIGEILVYYRKGDNDGTKHAKEMGEEIKKIRKQVIAETSDNEISHLGELKRIVELETKQRKKISDSIKIWKFYKLYINENLNHNDADYSILQTHLKLHIYSVCINNNPVWWAKIAKRIYIELKILRTKIGR